MKRDFVRQAFVRWSPIVAAFMWLSVSAAQPFDYSHALSPSAALDLGPKII